MYNTFNYQCVNCNCGASSKEKAIQITNSNEFDKQAKKVQKCPNNSKIKLKLMGMKTYSGGKYNSLSKEDKQKILKKRSSDHFKKHIEENKRDMIKKSSGL